MKALLISAASALLCASVSFAQVASPKPKWEVLGFNPSGTRLALERYAPPGESGEAVAQIFIIDVDKNTWAEMPLSALSGEELDASAGDLAVARARAKVRADRTNANRLRANGLRSPAPGESALDSRDGVPSEVFLVGGHETITRRLVGPIGGTLELSAIRAQSDRCNEFSPSGVGFGAGFSLKLITDTSPSQTIVLQQDVRRVQKSNHSMSDLPLLPLSRGCPNSYELKEARVFVAPNGDRKLAVVLKTNESTIEMEEIDLFLAITANLGKAK